MQTRTTISVIITNYNYERYIGSAIDSVIAQTRPADEIIVIDDGSTDRSRERIEAYGDKVRAIFQPNQGIKVISNTGYRISNGSVVLYLDADEHPLSNGYRAGRTGISPRGRQSPIRPRHHR